MPPAITSVSIAVAQGPLSAVDTDLIAIPWFDEDGPAAIAGLDAATGGEIARALGSKELRTKRYEIFLAPIVDATWRARRVMLVGGGRIAAADSDLVRKAAAAAGYAAKDRS